MGQVHSLQNTLLCHGAKIQPDGCGSLSKAVEVMLSGGAEKGGETKDCNSSVNSSSSIQKLNLLSSLSAFSLVQETHNEKNLDWLRDWMWKQEGKLQMYRQYPGLLEMVTVRTRWIDDGIMSSIRANNSKNDKQQQQQLVILKAGLDTRAFRLPLGDNVHVFEIDQESVFRDKLNKLTVAGRMDQTLHIAKRLVSRKISYVASHQKHGLARSEQYSWDNKPTTVVMEDITQYVPKEVTEDQLTKLTKVLPKGSVLLLTYADQEVCFDHHRPRHLPDQDQVGHPSTGNTMNNLETVRQIVRDQKWITGFTPKQMKYFLQDLGFQVEWDCTASDCRDLYATTSSEQQQQQQQQTQNLFLVGKPTATTTHLLSMERFVVARKQTDLALW